MSYDAFIEQEVSHYNEEQLVYDLKGINVLFHAYDFSYPPLEALNPALDSVSRTIAIGFRTAFPVPFDCIGGTS